MKTDKAIGINVLMWIGAAMLAAQGDAAETFPSGFYQVTTETTMPHLDENLRYATMRERRCLNDQKLSSAFPIMAHNALAGCTLDHENREGEMISYVLSCGGGHGTTGAARWQLGTGEIRGTLDVRLGGKNMTFSQRVTARPLHECESGPD
jgi:hypothetical protein